MPTGYHRTTVAATRSKADRAVSASVRSERIRVAGRILMCIATLFFSGCMLFERPVERAAPNGLGWLTNWNNQPLASTKPFDLETIKPTGKRATLVPEALIEITVWDLYEPGKPYSFPARVSPRHTIEIPMIGEHPVANLALSEVERTLVDEFARRDILKSPRVLVRSLDSTHVHVQVTGAVLRPGFVELTRGQASVYDAIVAAGGLKNLAGNLISITSNNQPPLQARIGAGGPLVRAQSPEETQPPFDPSIPRGYQRTAGNAVGPKITPAASSKPMEGLRSLPGPDDSTPIDWNESATRRSEHDPGSDLQSNQIQEVTVPTPGVSNPTAIDGAPPANRSGAVTPRSLRGGNRSVKSSTPPGDGRTRWFDVSNDAHRELLRNLGLNEGDTVVVKAAAPPIRVAGSVNRPGDYALPVDRSVDLWQALDLAGGIKTSGTPLYITLLRPPGDGHGPQRWQWQFESMETRPKDIPKVLPGDVIDLQPPAASRFRKAVGGLWKE